MNPQYQKPKSSYLPPIKAPMRGQGGGQPVLNPLDEQVKKLAQAKAQAAQPQPKRGGQYPDPSWQPQPKALGAPAPQPQPSAPASKPSSGAAPEDLKAQALANVAAKAASQPVEYKAPTVKADGVYENKVKNDEARAKADANMAAEVAWQNGAGSRQAAERRAAADKLPEENLDARLNDALYGDPADFAMSEEQMDAKKLGLTKLANDAESKLSQNLAGRGFGASGLAISGMGDIESKLIQTQSDADSENFALGAENQLNYLRALLADKASTMDQQTRKEIADKAAELEQAQNQYQKESDLLADQETQIHNVLADVGGEKWAADTLAWVKKQLKSGVPLEDILGELDLNGDLTVEMSPKAKQAAKAKADAAVASGDMTESEAEGGAEEHDLSQPPPGFEGDWYMDASIDPRYEWWAYDNDLDYTEAPSNYKGAKPWESLNADTKKNWWKKWWYTSSEYQGGE